MNKNNKPPHRLLCPSLRTSRSNQQPATDLPIPHDNTEEQIAELNELLIHVLDELADMKRVLQANAPKRQKQRPPSKRHPPSDEESSEEDRGGGVGRSPRPPTAG